MTNPIKETSDFKNNKDINRYLNNSQFPASEALTSINRENLSSSKINMIEVNIQETNYLKNQDKIENGINIKNENL